MIKKAIVLVIIVTSLFSHSYGSDSYPVMGLVGRHYGVGSRAFSFANNFTAISNDLSALYWNPAALSFLPVREFQISVDGFRTSGEFQLNRNSVTDYHERIKLTNAGLMGALPTIQGGFTMAAAYQNPFVFDDFATYSGAFKRDGLNETTDAKISRYGGLRMWSSGFGVQVAPNVGAGVSVSLIRGNYQMSESREMVVVEDSSSNSITGKREGSYQGYDLRGGLMYNFDDVFRLGMRIVIPQRIRFVERVNEIYRDNKTKQDIRYNYEVRKRLHSPLSGAMGAALTLPYFTVTTEGRFKFPYTYIFPNDDIPDGNQARRFIFGGGVGVEVPLTVVPIILRGGYSYDMYDLYPYVEVARGASRKWERDDVKVERNLQSFAVGMSLVTKNTAFELGYGFQTWALVSNRILEQDYNDHRLTTTFSVRY
ncbi:hypothetical protein QA601_12330 [Chitinispirillales bacterium ANBcel5]|uniref:hypothetical protein n=1 Tax=Cellulosispirillum alkaliphilum TaxID=3039283 RepID=UPI002A58ACCD|nr:hypothetical protein [Chitinispirillales bacterium ANBcel5]